ncbi:NAD-P-binding protein [Trametes polyzona]|nr:NAD-P-binding protein [Trametes polyzona]
MPPQTTWLVTGSNRGLGLEFVRQLIQSPENLVIATFRTPENARALNGLKGSAKGSLHVIRLDVNDFDNIRALHKKVEPILQGQGLDHLINNAGVASADTAFTFEPENLIKLFRINTVAPAMISKVLLPFLEKGTAKKILHVSSAAGSITFVKNLPPPYQAATAYPVSKCALNMLAYKQKFERPDFTIIIASPGWVKTDLGGPNATYTPEESVSGMLKVFTFATPADSGKFVGHDGQEVPW